MISMNFLQVHCLKFLFILILVTIAFSFMSCVIFSYVYIH